MLEWQNSIRTHRLFRIIPNWYATRNTILGGGGVKLGIGGEEGVYKKEIIARLPKRERC